MKTRLYSRDLSRNKTQAIFEKGYSVSIKHFPEDPPRVNRIRAVVKDIEIEILPSKGFSVGQIYFKSRPVLWEPPIGLCDPDTLDLYSDEIAINGNPSPGFTFLKTFASGIEFYGLRNWGMPNMDKEGNFLHPLHGETSNIPIDFFEVEMSDSKIILTASFLYRHFSATSQGLWHQEGEVLFEVKRKLIIRTDKPQIRFEDYIKNVSQEPLKPDWGYHITFLPENGSRIVVPSLSVENRSGENVPEDFERWTPAPNDYIRDENGIIHKRLKTKPSSDGQMSYALITHPNQSDIKINFPVLPYCQSWFCKGGANTLEFTRTSDGKPLFTKNWDGFGLEIGSSALDHNGNTDQVVPEQTYLKPEETLTTYLTIEFINEQEQAVLIKEIRDYNKKQVFI